MDHRRRMVHGASQAEPQPSLQSGRRTKPPSCQYQPLLASRMHLRWTQHCSLVPEPSSLPPPVRSSLPALRLCVPRSRIPAFQSALLLVPWCRESASRKEGLICRHLSEPALSSYTVPDTPFVAPRIRHHCHGDSQAPRPPATTPPTAPSSPHSRPLLDAAPRRASRPDVVATPRSIRHHLRFSLLAPASRQERPAVP
jgi:hypothetical protein